MTDKAAFFDDEELTEEELAQLAAAETAPETPEEPESQPEQEPEPKAEAADPEPEDEEPAEDGAEPEGKEKRTRTVPHEALHAERERRRKSEEALEAERAEKQAMSKRFDDIMARLAPKDAPKPEDAPKPPSFDEDFIAAGNQLAEQVQDFSQWREQEERAKAIQTEKQRFQGVVQSAAQQYVQEVPDLGDRDAFVVGQLARQQMAFGRSEAEAMQVALDQVMGHGYELTKRGENPRAMLDWIKEQSDAWGYQPKQPEQPHEAQPTAEPNPNDEQFRRKAEGAERGKSLSSVGGSAGAGRPSLTEMAKWSEEQVEDYFTKNPSEWARINGVA